MRLDVELVNRGLARSRSQAATLIERGRVLINGKAARKSSQPVEPEQKILVLEAVDYASRAGHKLAAALDEFSEIDVVGKLALDVGASTGGFTDVLLRRGASKVIALDVGHDQLVPALVENPNVINLERVNARDLDSELLENLTGMRGVAKKLGIIVADLSFISLTLVLPQLLRLAPQAEFVVLIKPQFEVGKQSLSASGVVNDHRLRAAAINQVISCVSEEGAAVRGLTVSKLPGTHGNIEYLMWISKSERPNASEWSKRVAAIARESE